MSTVHHHRVNLGIGRQHTRAAGITSDGAAEVVSAIIRVALGWVFLWAFLDKTFGLGHDTTSAQSWIHGGSPTQGFLAGAATGPFTSMYHQIAGQAWADWLFMAGLLGIGTALVLGVGMRLAAGAGSVLLILMWSVVLPPASNPFLDDHLVYALVLVWLAIVGAGASYGLGAWWSRLPVVDRRRWLR